MTLFFLLMFVRLFASTICLLALFVRLTNKGCLFNISIRLSLCINRLPIGFVCLSCDFLRSSCDFLRSSCNFVRSSNEQGLFVLWLCSFVQRTMFVHLTNKGKQLTNQSDCVKTVTTDLTTN